MQRTCFSIGLIALILGFGYTNGTLAKESAAVSPAVETPAESTEAPAVESPASPAAESTEAPAAETPETKKAEKSEPEAELTVEARIALAEQESANAVAALEALQKAPASVSVSEWKTERGYPWNQIPANLVEMPASEQMQELVLMRIFATTIDHLRKITTNCDKILNAGNLASESNVEFVRMLYASVAIQQADVILEKVGAFPDDEVRKVVPVLRDQAANLKKILTWDPDSAETNLFLTEMLGLIVQSENDPAKIEATFTEMRKYLDKGLEKAEAQEVPPVLQSLAYIRRALLRPLEELEQAIADLDLAETLDPSQAETIRGKKLVLYIQGHQMDKAMEQLNVQIQKLQEEQKQAESEGSLEKREFIQEQLKRMFQLKISMLAEMQKNDEALALIQELRKAEPKNSDLQAAELEILCNMGKTKECIELLGTLIEENPFNSQFVLMRARVLFAEKEYAKALEDAEKILLITPSDKDAEILRVFCLSELGRGDEAAGELQKKLKENPKDIGTSLLLAELLLQQKKAKDLAALLDSMKQTFQMESLCDTMAQQEEPMVDGEVLPGLEEDDTPSRHQVTLYYQLAGQFYLSAGKHKEAIDSYEHALKLDATDSVVCNNLAWVLATSPEDSLRNAERALEWATKACELTNYQEPGHLSTLAAAYAEKGDFETAKSWIAKALELAKDDAELTESLNKEKASYEAGQPVRERVEDCKFE